MSSAIKYGKSIADFTPRPMPHRDENSPTIDMNFNLLNQVIRSNSDRISSISVSLATVAAIPSISAANPSGTIGLAAVNGTATTYTRSDATHALSQAITPTWSALHTFTLAPKVSAFAGGGALMVTTDNVGQLGTQAIPTGATAANPTGTVGLSIVNGSASTFLRSDGAPAISQAIVPTWSANHTFSSGIYPSYATKGAIAYLTRDRYHGVVPFVSGAPWTSNDVTFSSSSILQTASGSVFHKAYLTYPNFNVAGQGFYVKYKFKYTSAAVMVSCGVSNSTTLISGNGALKATGGDGLVVGQPGGGSITTGFPSFTLVNGTTYLAEVTYYRTSSTAVTATFKLYNSTQTTLLSSGTVNTTGAFAGTCFIGLFCPDDTTTGELLDIATYGLDTDTGGGLLSNNPTLVYDERTQCVGIGTNAPTFSLDLSGSFRVNGTISLPSQTASRALFTDASSNMVTNAIIGTGNVVMSAGPTLTGTITAAIANFSGLVTFNGGATIGATRLQEAKGADVGSANDMTLGTGGNFFVITGTTQINRITTTGWQAGSRITLKFSGAITIAHQGAATSGALARLNLAGSANFVAANLGRLVLIYDGTDWWEIGRTIA